MPYERISHYRDESDASAPPVSTMIDGLEVVDDQAVVLAPLDTVESPDRRRGGRRPPRQARRPATLPRSSHGLG
jgi:hypothetical protein